MPSHIALCLRCPPVQVPYVLGTIKNGHPCWVAICYGADEGTCREHSERNSEWLCLHKGTSASHRIWVHTQGVVLKAQSPFKQKRLPINE